MFVQLFLNFTSFRMLMEHSKVKMFLKHLKNWNSFSFECSENIQKYIFIA